jgi:hypothetical protein
LCQGVVVGSEGRCHQGIGRAVNISPDAMSISPSHPSWRTALQGSFASSFARIFSLRKVRACYGSTNNSIW